MRYVSETPLGHNRVGWPFYAVEDEAGRLHYVVVTPDQRVLFCDAAGEPLPTATKRNPQADGAAAGALIGGMLGAAVGGPAAVLLGLIGAVIGASSAKPRPENLRTATRAPRPRSDESR